MTDVVYIVGTGSKMGNDELRYSLRSIEKHLKNVGNVYVIGHRPEWVTNVTHIPCNDEPGDKGLNIRSKTALAIGDNRVSEHFLKVYDDHFLLSDFSADNFPYFVRETLEEASQRLKGNAGYARKYAVTRKVLEDAGKPTLNYNLHSPFPIVKRHYFVPADKDVLIKSFYANFNHCPFERSKDYKLFEKKSMHTYLNDLIGARFFSVSDKAICSGLKELFQYLYPHKSKYENDNR